MSFSSIAAKQRKKEAQALKSFLAFSLIGSLALHIGVLTFVRIGNLLNRAPELEDEPIEVTIVSPASIQALEPKQEAQSKGGSGAGGGSGILSGSGSEGGSIAAGGGGGTSARAIARSEPSIIAEKQPTSVANAPRKKLVESLRTEEPTQEQKPAQTPEATSTPKPAQVTKPAQAPEATSTPKPAQQQKPAETAPPEIATQPKPVVTPSPSPSTSPEPAPTPQPVPFAVNQSPQNVKPTVTYSLPPQDREQSNEKLRDLLTGIRNSQQSPGIATNSTGSSNKPSGEGDRDRDVAANSENGTGSGSGTGTGSGSGIGTGNGSGKRTGTGTGNRSGSSSTVATGSGNSRRGTERGEGNGNGDSTGSRSARLTGYKCGKPKYAERARRLGQEGTAELSVDVDDKGNVTNVRLARSSGHSALDESAIREAWRCKFDASAGEIQGIIKFDFTL